MITKLQLGASSLDRYDKEKCKEFFDKTWLHLSTEKPLHEFLPRNKYDIVFFLKSGINFISRGLSKDNLRRLFRKVRKLSNINETRDLYPLTNYKQWYYKKGEKLPFNDNSVCYIFSEHFFEHLFHDEAVCLLNECWRILKPRGVIRIVVPDAIFRTYEKPEEPTLDNKTLFLNPDLHKIRYSVHSLSKIISESGFKPVPLRYCNAMGKYYKINIRDIAEEYKDCPEQAAVFDMNYIIRIDSLVIDGIKK
jgi:predicted SAM-dependent methyltransferase